MFFSELKKMSLFYIRIIASITATGSVPVRDNLLKIALNYNDRQKKIFFFAVETRDTTNYREGNNRENEIILLNNIDLKQ